MACPCFDGKGVLPFCCMSDVTDLVYLSEDRSVPVRKKGPERRHKC